MPTARSLDRKLSRKTDQRRILVSTLAVQLIEYGQITTTAPRAKALKPFMEKLVSSAVKGGLARRRKAIGQLDVYTANRLFDLIAPQMKRSSGFLTTSRAPERSGDLAPMVTVKFVDEISEELPKSSKPAKKASTKDSQPKTKKASSRPSGKSKTKPSKKTNKAPAKSSKDTKGDK